MQSTGHAGQALVATAAQLGHDHHVGAVVEDGAELRSGQCRRQASQLMHSDISMRSGGFFHFGFRSCASMRSNLVPAAMPQA